MSKILITGANGFLGQHLTIALASTNNEIIATGRGASRLPNGNYQYRSVELTSKKPVNEHGFLDAIVERKDLKGYLANALGWMTAGNADAVA